MKEFKIKLSSIAEATKFVDLASKCDFDIDLYCGHVMVDAKSLLGVVAMDFNKVLIVKFEGDNIEFESFMKEKLRVEKVA